MPHPQAEAICTEALTWRGTPFVDQAMRRGAGVDCAHLALAVAQALGLVDARYQAPVYHPGWHLHHPGEWLWETILALGGTPLVPAEATAGDLVLCRLPGHQSHGHCAILLPEGRMIHALQRLGVVVHGYDRRWQQRSTRAAQFPLTPRRL